MYHPPNRKRETTLGSISFLILLLSIPLFFIWTDSKAVSSVIRAIFILMNLCSLYLAVLSVKRKSGKGFGVIVIAVLAFLLVVILSSV